MCNDAESLTKRQRQKRCEPGTGTNGDPDSGRTTREGDPALDVVHQNFSRRPLGNPTGSLVSVALRKGWTAPHSRKEWAGWGWRHVAAKHGWGASDITATTAALKNPPVRNPTKGTLEYVGAQYRRNGELCVRRVAVADQPGPVDPIEKGIITSYGALVTP